MAKQYITKATKTALRASYDGCVCCGTWDAYDCGHVMSEARGGSVDLSNLRLMCTRCNGALGNANASFAKYATPNNGERAVVETNRAAWFAYCDAERAYWDAQDRAIKRGKRNPHKRPTAYTAPL